MDAATIRRGSGGSRSSSSSHSSTCNPLVPGPIITVSPTRAPDYDCTDCGSFFFGSRGRHRPRSHGAWSSSSHHHSRGNIISEPVQRLFLVGSTPVHHPATSAVSQQVFLPQNEQLHEISQATELQDIVDLTNATGPSVDVREPVSLEASDNEKVGNQRAVDFVSCHGATSTFAGNVNDSSSTLAEIFRCFICLGKVVDAQLCPCCSKLVCQSCIKRWLTDQKSECPHCRAPLLLSQLVSCRFISEISSEVEKIQGNLGDSSIEKQYCPAHDSPFLYFCTTCSVPVCPDCAVLIEDHRNHTFEKLSVAYGRHKKKIRMEAAGLRKRQKELSALVVSVEKNIDTVLKAKDESAAELQMAFKRMQSRLEEQLKCKLLALLAQKGSMTQEMELLDTILHELDQQLNSIPKSDLIAQEPNMSRMLQVVPSYEHGELILKKYKETITLPRSSVFSPGGTPSSSEALSSKDVVYSEPIRGSGITWRLKVYPNGSGASLGTHLSVFLEMVDGGNEAVTYEYGIELLHQTRPNQRIVRKFSSDYEVGACWGYYQFFRIDLLEKEGYLQPDEDTITLRFYVRPLTFQQQCQDLRRSLAALQVERDESATQVTVIRRAFATALFQRRRRRSNRTVGQVANEKVALAQAVATGTGTTIASNTLALRKELQVSSIKDLPRTMQDSSGTRAGKSWNLGMLPQCEDRCNSECTIVIHSEDISQAVAADSPVRPNESSLTQHDGPLGEGHFSELMTHPKRGDIPATTTKHDDDNVRALPMEPTATRKPKDINYQELWTKRGEESFQTPKVRSHKKIRSRKALKVLRAPEALPPFTDLSDTGGLDQQLASVSLERSPSTKKTANPAAPGNGHESSRNEMCEDGADSHQVVQNESTGPTVVSAIDRALIDEGMEEKKYLYYTSMSGSSNFCTPDIEDCSNFKQATEDGTDTSIHH
ncbi:uncharacterized protein [Physcomitrium patens]|uniref:uncharacterized protein isoform X3 n=1 Tax=Physcomitrium patens TaxID=3218 RepID=UPI000D179881|nr:uncharacterized protein LOC112280163 isoform X3 [Physcomitrium patens]|eukprot:XP_024371078.1 uncharacterized protein LOC112280163 isoform X3 [Physcomitrella patens]